MSKHMVVSLVKSAIRILACAAGIAGMIATDPATCQRLLIDTFGWLLVAEIVGILEEVHEK